MSSMAVIGDYWGRKRHLHRTGSECRCSQARRCACIAPCKQPKSQLKQDWMRGVLALRRCLREALTCTFRVRVLNLMSVRWTSHVGCGDVQSIYLRYRWCR
jgi:hypothetical protein